MEGRKEVESILGKITEKRGGREKYWSFSMLKHSQSEGRGRTESRADHRVQNP